MYLGRAVKVLKTSAGLFAVCLLGSACTTNAPAQIKPEDNSWIRCHSSENGEGWECDKGSEATGSRTKQQFSGMTGNSSVSRSTSSASETAPPVQEIVDAGGDLLSEESEESRSLPETPNETDPDISPGNDANYSIQLAAFLTRERRDTYLQSVGLNQTELELIQGQRAGQTWWLVLYGKYREYAEALEAQAELVQNHGLTDTWIKPLD